MRVQALLCAPHCKHSLTERNEEFQMPKFDASSPAASQPILRLCLGVSSVRGVSSSLNLPG